MTSFETEALIREANAELQATIDRVEYMKTVVVQHPIESGLGQVRVNLNGSLLGIDFDQQALSSVNERRLSDLVKAAVTDAAVAAAQRKQQIEAEPLIKGSKIR